MKQEPDFFRDQELELVYIAKRLREALTVEELLTKGGVDYLVEPDEYSGGILFRATRVGAFFYVLPAASETTRRLLIERGYKPYRTGPAGLREGASSRWPWDRC